MEVPAGQLVQSEELRAGLQRGHLPASPDSRHDLGWQDCLTQDHTVYLLNVGADYVEHPGQENPFLTRGNMLIGKGRQLFMDLNDGQFCQYPGRSEGPDYDIL